MDEQNNSENSIHVAPETLWYLNNYILLKDYLDRTVSRIAARCIRKNNIAIEEYPFYSYILDVLEEINETGDFILQHKELYPLVEKKIKGGMKAFQKNLNEYKQELRNNSTPDMIKQDTASELEKMKETLGMVDKGNDPTAKAGMSMDEVVEKLMNKQNITANPDSSLAQTQAKLHEQNQNHAPNVDNNENTARQNNMKNMQNNAEPMRNMNNEVKGNNPADKPVVQRRIIKKIVKIIKPVAAPMAQSVPDKVTEE